MNRHGPHIAGLAKGLALFGALILLLRTGAASELVTVLQNRLYSWAFVIHPLYWLVVLFAGLLLVFPFSLIQDHFARIAEGQHEEAPASYWLKGLFIELGIGVFIFSLFSGSIYFTPSYWWIIMMAVWIAFHGLHPLLHKITFQLSDHEEESLPDLCAAMKTPMETAGITLRDVHPINHDEGVESMEKDVILIKSGRHATVFIPREWVTTWSADEITAVTLHKAWMERTVMHMRDLLVHAVTAGFGIAGFALAAPTLARLLPPGDPHPLLTTTMLAAWMLPVLFILRIVIQPFYRRWVFDADEHVARMMHSPNALAAVLSRAIKDLPAETNIPSWAEFLFFSAPSLQRRIARLERTEA